MSIAGPNETNLAGYRFGCRAAGRLTIIWSLVLSQGCDSTTIRKARRCSVARQALAVLGVGVLRVERKA
jgi:hypothetical protein